MKGTRVAGGIFQQVLKNVSNLLPASSLEGEVQAARIKLEQLICEKERADALLKEKEEQLHLNAQTQQKLQSEVTSLRKLKEFKPVLSFHLEQALHMGGLNWPRRASPVSAYKLFIQDQWNQAKSENPNARSSFLLANLAAKWRMLNAEEKKLYQEKFEAEKEAYLQVAEQEKYAKEALKLFREEQKQKAALDLLNQYIKYREDAEGDENNKRRKERDSLKPKKPLSGFLVFFCERCTALFPEKRNLQEVTKSLGREWRSMTKEERAPYEQISAEAKQHYMQAMELYKQEEAEEAKSISIEQEEWRKVEREQGLRLLRKKEKGDMLSKATSERKQRKEKKTHPNRPRKPPSAFLLFSKETRANLNQTKPGISNTALLALISVRWKEMGDVEKQKWIDQATNASLQYKKEMEEFKKSLEEQQQQQ